ncbi:hypothetical protein DPMN_004907 [Dreissena polymorpha]|uniref:Uncharacterized protein n=1 Tax=Dreissena polymorpha TaxID=45954 RepID=A0A9D4MS72_DREPO|nr:hypothetical protein DPMN_004907 [Dreissena polymorpha]
MFTDSSSSVSTTLPVYIVLNSANPAQCAYPLPVLPCIEYIGLESITCSSTWLRSLFSTLLTLEQNAVCVLTEVSCQGTFIDAADLSSFKKTLGYGSNPSFPECDVLWEVLHGLNIKSLSLDISIINYADSISQSLLSLTHLDTLSIQVDYYSAGLWEVLHGLNIKSLSLSGRYKYKGVNVNCADSMSQSLLSLTHLDTLSIKVVVDSPGLWKALHGLNIKSLSLCVEDMYRALNVDYADSMSQSLLSLTHLDTLSIKVDYYSAGLWEALHGLNIKSLSLSVGNMYRALNVHNADSMSQSLLSLTHLDTLSIKGGDDSPGLWKALHGLNIKSLSLCVQFGYLNVHNADSMSQSLSSLTHLDTLSIKVVVDSPGLWKALHGLHIKSLSLCVGDMYRALNVNYADSMAQSLPSLTHLDTLSVKVNDYSPGLWEALHGLNIKSLSLSLGYMYRALNVHNADSISQSLLSLTHLDTLSIEVDDDSPGLWKALHGLNIKSLSLSGGYMYSGFSVNYADSMSQSLLSLTHLDTLNVKVDDDSPGLWKALHGLNIKSLGLSGGYMYSGFSGNYADSMSQSLLSLTHLDTLSIKVDYYSPGLWEALHGLNIKSLSLSVGDMYRGLNVHNADSMSQSLLSLTHLDTLSIEVDDDSPGLWKALHGLNIKSLSLSGGYMYSGFSVNYADSMSQSLLSLTHLDTLNVKVDDDSPGLWKALHALNIKSLSLSGGYMYSGFSGNYADSMSQSLLSLTHLDTLSIKVDYYSPGLWEALHGLNIKSLSLSVGNMYRGLNVHNADSMSQSLLSLTHLDTLSIEMDDDSLDLWEALRGLNIKCLSLCVAHGGLNVDYADSMSQSLSSLTHLDTLSIKVVVDSPGLWKALHGLNIKNLSLCVAYGGLNIDYADSMSQSL